MKNLISAAVIITALSGCGKENEIKPNVSDKDIAISNPIQNQPNTSHTTFNVGYELPAQVVTTQINSNNLVLTYNENVSLLVNPTEYDSSWALHLKEDFSQTGLKDVTYTTVTPHGITVTNWIDDNLNNVTIKTKKDTMVNNKNLIKLTIERQFKFAQLYSTQQEATTARNNFLTRKNDVIKFSSFYYSEDKTIMPAAQTAKLVYVTESSL